MDLNIFVLGNDQSTREMWIVKETACDAGDPGSIPGSGRSPGERNDTPLQYSCPEYPMDGRGYSPWGCKESDTTEQLHFL